MQIRPMTAEDKPRVMAFLPAIAEFKPEEVALAEELIDLYLLHSKRSGYHILVADTGGKVLGYVCYGPTPITEGTWDLYWIATDPREQSQGVGGALMAFAETEMRKAAARMCLVETSSRPEYERIRRFYFHQGYAKICEVPDFYAPGDNRVILCKRFTGTDSGRDMVQ